MTEAGRVKYLHCVECSITPFQALTHPATSVATMILFFAFIGGAQI